MDKSEKEAFERLAHYVHDLLVDNYDKVRVEFKVDVPVLTIIVDGGYTVNVREHKDGILAAGVYFGLAAYIEHEEWLPSTFYGNAILRANTLSVAGNIVEEVLPKVIDKTDVLSARCKDQIAEIESARSIAIKLADASKLRFSIDGTQLTCFDGKLCWQGFIDVKSSTVVHVSIECPPGLAEQIVELLADA